MVNLAKIRKKWRLARKNALISLDFTEYLETYGSLEQIEENRRRKNAPTRKSSEIKDESQTTFNQAYQNERREENSIR